MAFSDRFAITDFSESKSRISFSIDDHGDGIMPVLLLVPDINLGDHDHVELNRVLLKKLKTSLNENKSSTELKCCRFYSLKIHKENNSSSAKVELFETFQGKKLSLYSIDLSKNTIIGLSNWIDEYLNTPDSILQEKFKLETYRKK